MVVKLKFILNVEDDGYDAFKKLLVSLELLDLEDVCYSVCDIV